MHTRFTLPTTLLLLLLTLTLTLTTTVQAIPPRRAAQLQHFQSGASPSSYNREWTPEPEPSSSNEADQHIKCTSTRKLLDCRDTCYTTYGPYSNFYGDCLDCCRKVCEATAYCPAGINYWRKKPSTESYGIKKLWGGK